MKYIISNEAANDLEEIWFYTFENWSAAQADKYLNLIFDEVEYITENPHIGQDYSFVKKGYYRYQVKSHFIFYKINPKEEVIEIIRILHQRVDIENRLNE